MSDYTFVLIQEAKKTGGDKYVCETDDKFMIYFPQSVSRKGGKILQKLIINIKWD